MRYTLEWREFAKISAPIWPTLGGICLLVLASLTFPSARSQGAEDAKAEKPAAKKNVETATYYVGDLVERATAWRKTFGKDAPNGIEGVAHVLLTNIDPESWSAKDADHALTELATFDARKSQIAELRFFGGLSLEETGHVLGVSVAVYKSF